MMIELAPVHKIGLSLTNPVLIAAGCGGYGPEYRRLLDLSAFGALVTNPITLRPQRGSPQPRLLETQSGLILQTGRQNPGVKKVIRQYAKFWRALGLPIIAHLPAAEPDDLLRVARALAGSEAIAAIELGIAHDALPRDIRPWVEAIREGCMVPILAKLPLGASPEMIGATIDAIVDALVIASPPMSAMRRPGTEQIVSGHLYGPALHHLALYDVQRLLAGVDLPVIAVGGIHTLADARAFLDVGASAVQIDTLLWTDPRQAERIARAFAENGRI